MELKEFIKTTLTEIVEAVKETQETVKDSRGYSSPDYATCDSNKDYLC